MAIHPDLKSLLRESVREYLEVAEYCVAYRKDAGWPKNQENGCLGYPAAVMLFSIVDTIGSYHRGDSGFRVNVDGHERPIKSDGFQQFFVLNSEYYGQQLTEVTIRKLYYNFRSTLMHNAALAPAHFLLNAPDRAELFPVAQGKQGVNLGPFMVASRLAVQKFMSKLDAVVPSSEQARHISLKR